MAMTNIEKNKAEQWLDEIYYLQKEAHPTRIEYEYFYVGAQSAFYWAGYIVNRDKTGKHTLIENDKQDNKDKDK